MSNKIDSITFQCKTNHQMPYVNTAIFLDHAGNEYVIDRETTAFSYDKEKETMGMEWISIYIWDGENCLPVPENFFDDKVFVGFDIEDDAPDGYVITSESLLVDSKEIISLF